MKLETETKIGCYTIFFNRSDLEVDQDGNITNGEELYIMNFCEDEYWHRIEITDRGELRNIPANITMDELMEMEHVGDGAMTVRYALDRLYAYLESYYITKIISPGTYWEPEECIVVGLR